jgi:hypothetical protein
VTRGAALLAIASFGLAACESKTVVTPSEFPITVTVTPASVTLTAVNQTAQFVALVSGGPAGTAGTVTWTSSNTAVATVDANGVVTAKANGSTSIIAQATADANKKAAGVVTVAIPATTPPVNPAAPTISIQSITDNFGNNVDITNTFGQINVALNVDVPTGNTINSVNVQIDGTTVCSQTFTQGTQAGAGVEAANAVVIVCSINTAKLNANGTPVYANGPHTITATLVAPGGVVKASTSQSITFNNASALGLAVSFTKTATAANGQVWNGGAVTVVVTPAIFGTQVLTAITVNIGGASKTQAVSGTGPQTFVFVDTAGSALKVAAPQGLTAITATSTTTAGTAGPNGALPSMLIDEVPPAFAGAFTFPSGAVAPFWFNAGSLLTLSKLGLTEADGGVDTDVVTIAFAPAATPTALTTVTTIGAIGQQAAGSTILKVTSCDALANCASTTSAAFGVDLVAPVITIQAGSPADKAVNPGAGNYSLLVTDTGTIGTVVSGVPAGAFKIYVKEFIPAGNKCYNPVTTVESAVPSSGCPFVAAGLAGVATYAFPLSATEAYDSVVVFAVDSAGNASSTVARIALVDTHAPSIAGITSPASILGGASVAFGTNVADNIDLKSLSGTEAFTDATTFTLGSTTLDAFGLPETTAAAASLTVNPFVTSLQYTAANVPAGASVDAATINLIVSDQVPLTATRSLAIAGNIVTQVAFNWTAAPTNLASFTLGGVASPATLVHPVTETLSVAAIVPTGQATPFSQVQFYEITTGAPAIVGSTLTLVATVPGNAGFVSETVVQRTITYSTAVSIPAAGSHTYVVVGVDASGHGVVSGVVTVTVT